MRPFRLSFCDVVWHRQHLAVLVDGHLGAASPAPPVDDPAAPGRTDARAQRGVVEATRDRRRERAGIAGRALQHRVAVGARHLGQRTAVGGDERDAGAHRLDGGQAEALVEARHDGQLGLGIELDDPLVGYPRHEVDVRAQTELVDEVHALAGLRLADDRQRDVALGAQLRHRLEQVGEPLQGDVGRGGGDQPARHAGDAGERSVEVGVDADGHQPHPVVAHAHVGVDVVDRVLTDDHDPWHPAGDAALHPHERVPASDRVPLEAGRRGVHLELAILGDRVVQRDDRRHHRLDLQDPVAEALVVVDEIELADAWLQVAVCPGAERQRLGERPGHELGDLQEVLAGLELPVGGETAGIVVVPEVEAGQLRDRHARVEHGVRLTAEHLDVGGRGRRAPW